MAIKVGLLGFGTVASGVPFLLKENKEKIEKVMGIRLKLLRYW